jgi:4-amino-4-deoxy-L-arabinose transferase-like glycosyltransferase
MSHRAAEDPSWIERHRRVLLAALVVVAFGLRVAHLLALRETPLFAADHPPSDEHLYHVVARTIVTTDRTGGIEIGWVTSPVYVAFLAVFFKIFGDNVLLPRLVQCALGVATMLMLYAVARRVFGLRAAVATAALTALYGTLVFYDASLLKASLGLTLLSGTLLALVTPTEQVPRPARALLGGFALALASLTSGGTAPIAIVAIVWLWLSARRETMARPWAPALAFALGVLMVLAPFAMRDRFVAPGHEVFAHGGGIHFYIGNHTHANGTYTRLAHIRPSARGHAEDAVNVAAEALGRPLTPAEASRYWWHRGAEYWIFDLKGALKLSLRKLYLFWNAYEIPNNEDYNLVRSLSRPLRVAFVGWSIVAPLALLALATGVWRRRGGGLLVASLAVVCASVVAMFVTARYRLPAVPLLLLLAGGGVEVITSAFESRQRRVFVSALVAVCVVLVNLPSPLPVALIRTSSEATLARLRALQQRESQRGATLNGSSRRPNR